MRITPIKTHKITTRDKDIYVILDRYLPRLHEGSIVAITSKIISICEGRIVPVASTSKDDLIEQEADFLFPGTNPYHIRLTLKNNILISSAGIDASNADKNFVLWPSDAQKSANAIRTYLKKKHGIKRLGVIITDSHSSLLRRGTVGFALSFSGFKAIKNYIGEPDIFKRKLIATMMNHVDGLASSAVLLMGEGKEQTPLALIEQASFVKFVDRNPSEKELKELFLSFDEDVYIMMLRKAGILGKKQS